MWSIEWDEEARKELRRLSHPVQQQLIQYLEQRIATPHEPRRFGKALTADLRGLWRYRVGDYRIVCRIEKEKLIVLVLHVGHRRHIYE
ncbi:MAG: type II toxin-antitoxin system RelE/ParE family toxin [Alphaproteobacteria bacterium]|nr:type II toxin-antitoxin system RelE/ParE family toxin [Alphaproteobacteria bacterium]